MSEESPWFVGWGSGDPDEATKLLRTLAGDAPKHERIAAAADLANLGSSARPALPGLRRVLSDPDPSISLAAAGALARLDSSDDRGLATIRRHLRHSDAVVRSSAAGALGEIGPGGCAALEDLLAALGDKAPAVRRAAAEAVGRVGPHSTTPEKCVAALARLLKAERNGDAWFAAADALVRFGAHSWAALATVREVLLTRGKGRELSRAAQRLLGQFIGVELLTRGEERELSRGTDELVALLGRFDPPVVESLTEFLQDKRWPAAVRESAVPQLRSLGHRARLAVPALAHLAKGTILADQGT
jgi:HEAT repeat protein